MGCSGFGLVYAEVGPAEVVEMEMTGQKELSAKTEFGIWPEMVKVGAAEVVGFEPKRDNPEDVAVRVYKIMECARIWRETR